MRRLGVPAEQNSQPHEAPVIHFSDDAADVDVGGPDEWRQEQDAEYETLTDALQYSERHIMDFVLKTHGGLTRPDGSPRVEHLKAVAVGAERLATRFFADCVLISEKRYHVKVCRLAGLLHESLIYTGQTYERIVSLGDRAVAEAVSAMTPCNQDPFSRRIESLANRIGRNGPHAQLIKIVDLLHDGQMYDAMIDAGTSGVGEDAEGFALELSYCLGAMGGVEKHPDVKMCLEKLKALPSNCAERLTGRCRRTAKKQLCESY